MKTLSTLKLLLLTLSLMSCALMDIRDYEDEMDEFRTDDPMFMAGTDFEISAGDYGNGFRNYDTVINRTPPLEHMRARNEYQRSLASELDVLEQNMKEGEYAHYESVRHLLGTESERIYFINLTRDEKLSYLELKGLKRPEKQASRSIASVQGPGGLKMGMTMGQVVNFMGYPERKEVAGEPGQHNERWTYNTGDGVQYIYFAKAKVEGWE